MIRSEKKVVVDTEQVFCGECGTEITDIAQVDITASICFRDRVIEIVTEDICLQCAKTAIRI